MAAATASCRLALGLQDDGGLFDALWLPVLPVRSFSPRADNQFFLSGELFSLSTTSVSFLHGDLKRWEGVWMPNGLIRFPGKEGSFGLWLEPSQSLSKSGRLREPSSQAFWSAAKWHKFSLDFLAAWSSSVTQLQACRHFCPALSSLLQSSLLLARFSNCECGALGGQAASRRPWVTSARAFLGEAAFFPTSGGEEHSVLVTQCLIDILEEGISLGEVHGLAPLCLAGVQAAAVWVLRVPVGVFVDRGRSPE